MDNDKYDLVIRTILNFLFVVSILSLGVSIKNDYVETINNQNLEINVLEKTVIEQKYELNDVSAEYDNLVYDYNYLKFDYDSLIYDQSETIKKLNKSVYYYKENQRIIIQNKTKIRVGSISIEITDKCGFKGYANGCNAWTDGVARIYIVNNQSLRAMKLACNHERLHIELNIKNEEYFIMSIDDKFNFRECEAFFKLM